MKNLWVLAALAVVVMVVILLVPPQNVAVKINSTAAVAVAEATPEAGLFRSLYGNVTPVVEERACVAEYLERYVKDVSMPLNARDKGVSCSNTSTDWMVTYTATGIVDTDTLYVGVRSDGSLINASFISPYDDIYLLNYSFGTLEAPLEAVMKKGGFAVSGGWADITIKDTKYLAYLMPGEKYTAVALYVEKTPAYRGATVENLRSDITAAHGLFETEGKNVTSMMRKGFIGGNYSTTVSYLYYPMPK